MHHSIASFLNEMVDTWFGGESNGVTVSVSAGLPSGTRGTECRSSNPHVLATTHRRERACPWWCARRAAGEQDYSCGVRAE